MARGCGTLYRNDRLQTGGSVAAQVAGPFETRLKELVEHVHAPEAVWAERAWARLDSLTKPPRSLGCLEELAVRLACSQRTERPEATPSALVLMAGDHGVVAEGVSAWPSAVTMQMMANFAAGGAAINQLARQIGTRLVLVDVGVAGDTSNIEGVLQAKVRPGTANMA
ncbi:nicotinate-nucleotide--dimethylbenzimidazole phosphoribosyltransferase, partial [bacterium]|nr:nicotinate-nucleotide--dimethylbenzimidazole phosphoribosyltransferase [bacterium]